ncbi:ABC transporter ATP-binding protein [Streptomyces sp. SID12501]|uniref:ABC transporter ATP-binding protein n=1 Tax=Streptomyces sp. SID12501 TaxID=2706042 RepID=A0A6B3BFY3_9ACTN|nr:ABC transporter ATP-binding protein [Streptomyces sp. SID12501]NEC84710.1 ABC transporter ATP-binding protein [Streptomyces sp. SID12501]
MFRRPSTSPAQPETTLRLRRELFAHPGPLAVAVLLALTATAAGLSVPLLVKDVITRFATHESLTTPITWMCVTAVVGAASQAGSGFLLARIGERMIYHIRTRIMDHSLRLPMTRMRSEGVGNLTTRITSDALLMRQVVDVGAQLPLSALTVLFTLGVMAWIDWVLTLVTIASLAIVTVALTMIISQVKDNIAGQQNSIGLIAQRFTASLESLTTIKAYRAEKLALRGLSADADELRAISVQGAKLLTAIPAVTTLGNQFAMIAVILTGGARMAAGDLGIADFAAFILYILQAIPPATALTQGFGRIQAGLAARDRCNELLALPQEADGTRDLPEPEPVPGQDAVTLHDVTYTHPGATAPALRAASFTTRRQGLTAVVGASGAGKTTALSLIDRFDTPDEGHITVLGHPLDRWPLDALRSRISYVDQSFTLLEATVRENLQLGRTTPISEDDIRRTLESVGLLDEIARLPQGLDTPLGRAINLSGGQRQRMALARALLSQAEIVLLDEPTSQLDGINEQRFRAVVDDLATKRSVIVVAHRLSTVQHASHVVMMDQGRVLDTGPHHILMERCEAYRTLVRSQIIAGRRETPAPDHMPAAV